MEDLLKQIVKAKEVTNKAINLFVSTLRELEKSNAILDETITSEYDEIAMHTKNIQVAREEMVSNNTIIEKLKEFLPTA